MTETVIKYKTQILAEKIGFRDGIVTQSLLQKWLREEKNAHIEVSAYENEEEKNITYDYCIYCNSFNYLSDDLINNFISYEAALETALQDACKSIYDCENKDKDGTENSSD